jgi:lipoyl-dependent peroxiredoxin subunit D
MSIQALKDRLPEYARDLKLNLGGVTTTSELTEQQLWGSVLTAAIVSRNPEVLAAVAAEAAGHLSPEAERAARAAAAIMGMNNVYYRFLHLAGNDEYDRLPARLRMQVIGKPGVEQLDFELWSLVASAINGCGSCLKSHDKVVRDKGATAAQVQDAVRVASVIHAVAVTLEVEAALPAAQQAA